MQNLELKIDAYYDELTSTQKELILDLEIGKVVEKDIVVDGIDLSLSRAERQAFQDLLDDVL